MRTLLLLAAAGLVAQLVDGSLGMAFGVTSTTLLLTMGITPALASASVHLAEVGTTLVSGVAHWRFGNVEWSRIAWLALPGGMGAFAGAVTLTSIPVHLAEPVVAVILFCLGAYILVRFTVGRVTSQANGRPLARRLLAPLGAAAGFLDAVGGGGWGPIGSSTLLATGRMSPRKVVGTVSASEFIVTVSASAGFLFALTSAEIPFQIVAALLAGGAVAAPLAAWVVRYLHAKILGTFVGGLIIFTNTGTFLSAIGGDALVGLPVYAAVVFVWLTALSIAVTGARRDREASAEKVAATDA